MDWFDGFWMMAVPVATVGFTIGYIKYRQKCNNAQNKNRKPLLMNTVNEDIAIDSEPFKFIETKSNLEDTDYYETTSKNDTPFTYSNKRHHASNNTSSSSGYSDTSLSRTTDNSFQGTAFSYSNDSQSDKSILDSSSSGYMDSSLPSTIERDYSFKGMQNYSMNNESNYNDSISEEGNYSHNSMRLNSPLTSETSNKYDEAYGISFDSTAPDCLNQAFIVDDIEED